MRSEVRDLTAGPLGKGIFLFSVPLILSNLLQILFNMSDIAVVGRFAGAAALGSVGSTTTLVTLFTGFLIGVGSGINVVVARYLGQRHDGETREAVHTAFILCLLIGAAALLVGELTAGGILKLLRTKEELIHGAVLYLRIYFLGMPALALYNFGNAVFSAAGDTKKPLFFLLMAGALNVLLNLLFVIGFRMDVAGVALASILSQYLSAVCVVVALSKSEGPHALKAGHMSVEWRKAQLMLSISLPAGVQNAIFQLANLFVQFGVNSFDTATVAGNAAAQNADGLVYDVMAAFYTACGSYMGQNYGAGKLRRTRNAYRVSLFMSFFAGAGIGLTLYVFGHEFLSLFTSDPDVAAAGMFRLKVMGLSYGFSAFMDCTIAASRALGRGSVPTVIVLLGSCLFRIVWIFTVFAYFRTITSLYLVYIFSWIITAAGEYIYFRKVLRETGIAAASEIPEAPDNSGTRPAERFAG